MSRPSVSTIIPTYNRAQSIGAAIRSVLGQEQPPEEVVVVNDGSTDHTLTVLEEFGDRIIVIDQANSGVAAARNAGAMKATGDWLTFNDSDDLWCDGRMAILRADLAQMSADEVAHISNVRFVGAGSDREWFDIIGLTGLDDGPKRLDLPLSHFLHSLFLQGAAFRRDLFVKLDGFDVSFRTDEDAELGHRFALEGAFVCRSNVAAIVQRLDGDDQALSFLRRKDPMHYLELKETQFRRIIARAENADDIKLAAQAVSSCLRNQAMVLRSEGNLRGALERLARSAISHPNLAKGSFRALQAAVRPVDTEPNNKNDFRSKANP